jgi:hypothetical protein
MSKKEPLLIKQVGSRTFVDRGDELHPVLQFPITTDRGDMTMPIKTSLAKIGPPCKITFNGVVKSCVDQAMRCEHGDSLC